jgi:peroxiredoxin
MKKLLLLIVLLPLFSYTQNYKFDGQIKGLTEGKIGISAFYGNEDKAFDSIPVSANGKFEYSFPVDLENGMYRLRFNQNQFIDIIYNYENIDFHTVLEFMIDSLVFTQSKENQLYFEYLNQRNLTEYKNEMLDPLIAYYPKDDPFYEDIYDKVKDMRAGFEDFVDELIKDNKETFVSRIIKADFTPYPPISLTEMARINYMRAHFFDNIDFSDTSLLRTNVISGKMLQYLSLYQNNRMPKEQLELEFIKAVTVIMNATKKNPIIYEYVMDYLIGGFESYGFEKVITYIADNINLDETCVNTERQAELEKKVESLKKFAVGKKAPDFTTTDINGNEITLSKLGSEYTLLVFWATWCPHCTTIVPELAKLYLPGNKDKLEIIAVSLDDNKEDLDAFIRENKLDWINIGDLKKWKGEVVQAYDIFATPTMYLLYQDQTILAKPITLSEVKNALFERNILK